MRKKRDVNTLKGEITVNENEKTNPAGAVELTDKELEQAAGGAWHTFDDGSKVYCSQISDTPEGNAEFKRNFEEKNPMINSCGKFYAKKMATKSRVAWGVSILGSTKAPQSRANERGENAMNENKKNTVTELTDDELGVVAGGQMSAMMAEHTCGVTGCEYKQKEPANPACLHYIPASGESSASCSRCACSTNGNCKNGDHY